MTKRSSFLRYAMLMMRKNHNSNKRKGVYNYMLRASVKIIGIYLIIVVPFILIMKRLIDFNNIFQFLTDNFSDAFVFVLFTVSESLLGMIPPDFFVIWAAKFNSPVIFLSLLGILSYAGGVISYFIGHWLAETPRIKAYSERVLDKYIILVRKWGGAFIIIAALFPFSPYSMVVMAVALLKYPFRLYLLFAISRIARFLIQGVLYLDILKIDSFFG
ncbi:MAG: VTT domain-containing protein [Bacteroidales bacterium]|nr:VTT domain-containing protein [Bacteroidales bacterium]